MSNRLIRALRKEVSREKLILTLLVKNEADVILDNIFFHYAHGVDFVIVTDNGSTDGTLELLQELHEKNLIHLLQKKEYLQTKWVNNMAEIAREKFGATILIHSDADEFWNPVNSSSLKRSFMGLRSTSVLVNRHDVLPDPGCIEDDFPQKDMKIISKHLVSDDIENDSREKSLFLFRLPPKVMFSVKDKMRYVGKGNHLLAEDGSGIVSEKINIYHFPFKSAKRFRHKVTMACEAVKSIKEISQNKTTSWHWKRWCERLDAGRLEEEIDILIPSLEAIKGIEYKKFDYSKAIVRPILKSRYRKDYKELKLKEMSIQHDQIGVR